jgi:hypothetical protein
MIRNAIHMHFRYADDKLLINSDRDLDEQIERVEPSLRKT